MRGLTPEPGGAQSLPIVDRKAPESVAALLAQLQEVLGVAAGLAEELSSDDLFRRLVEAFRKMPMQDRPTIIGILEREVTGRLLSRATEKAVGQSTHVNPHARLYVRAHSSNVDSRIFDRDEMMIADVRAMRIAGLIRYVPDIYALWKDALREAVEQVDDATLANAEQLLRDGLECVVEARAAARTEDPPAEPLDATANTRRS